MYRNAASRLRALKGRVSNRAFTICASSSVVASNSSSSGGLFSWLTGKRACSSTPLDFPLKGVTTPPPLPDYTERSATKITTLPNGSSKAASNCSEICSYMGGLNFDQKQMIKKLVNFRMKEGRKNRSSAIVYQTLNRLARTEHDVIKLLVDAVDNIKPICEVSRVRVAASIYDVPGNVGRDRQQTLAIRWILEAAFKRRISYRISLDKCAFDEILGAYRKRGIARKKRENLHGLAAANRSLAHLRKW